MTPIHSTIPSKRLLPSGASLHRLLCPYFPGIVEHNLWYNCLCFAAGDLKPVKREGSLSLL